MAITSDTSGVLTLTTTTLDDSDVEDHEPTADVDAEHGEQAADDDVTSDRPDQTGWRVHVPLTVALAVVVLLTGLVAWLGVRFYQAHQDQAVSNQFLQTARQGALNLTTIDWRHADDDVRRIMDGATGEFYDDFANRSQPFVEVVKQAQSVSVGTVTEAGLESHSAEEAQALVAVSVNTSNTAGANQPPRSWRMRIAVHKVDGQFKISRVEFVP